MRNHTSASLREAADAVEALSNGKPIQFRNFGDDEWMDWGDYAAAPLWAFESTYWRPKPDAVQRPWSKPEDVPGPVCWIRADSRYYGAMIVGIDEYGVWTAGGDENIRHTWAAFKTPTQYSTDMKTWSPCVVVEQE